MKQFVLLLSACALPICLDCTVPADESQSIALTSDQAVQLNEVTSNPADTDGVSAKSDVSIAATVNAPEDPVDENVPDVTVDGTDSAEETEVIAVPSEKQIVIRLSGKEDDDSALEAIIDDPQLKTHTNGKIVVIGPDGKRQEFVISGNEGGNVFKIITEANATGNEDQQTSQFDSIVRILKQHGASLTDSNHEPVARTHVAIGVQCECVSDALRSHLDLGEKGIMIVQVREQSPAFEAALMKFDIIVQIDDTDVTTTDELVSSVTASEGKELTLSIIRQGKPMKVTVTPRTMEFPVLLAPAQTGVIHRDLSPQIVLKLTGNPEWQSLPDSVKKQLESQIGVQSSLRKFHPGIVIEQRVPSSEKDMQGLIEHLRKLAEDSGKDAQTKTQTENASDESSKADRIAHNIDALRGQVRAMEQKLEQLEKQLTADEERKK